MSDNDQTRGETYRNLRKLLLASAPRDFHRRTYRGVSAEDLVNDVILKLIRRGEKGDRFLRRAQGLLDRGRLPGPLRLELHSRAKKLRISAQSNMDPDDLASVQDRRAQEPQCEEGVNAFLSQLSPELEQAFRLKEQGYSKQMIARKLGLPERTLRRRWRKMRQCASAAGLVT